jgi:hypothetical protein
VLAKSIIDFDQVYRKHCFVWFGSLGTMSSVMFCSYRVGYTYFSGGATFPDNKGDQQGPVWFGT